MLTRVFLVACAVALACSSLVSGQQHPDFQGYWTNGTITPLQRPAEFKDRLVLSAEDARSYEAGALDRFVSALDPADRVAADLNDIYLETSTLRLTDRRTSLIVDPPDGRLPPLLPAAQERAKAADRQRSFDDPETLTLDERCLAGTSAGSSQLAAPIVPTILAQNYYQIVQAGDTVMIHTEVVHDTRIVRMNAAHLPPTIQRWSGDSIGRWDGETLVVDTTNFTPKTHFRGSGERMHVVERFTRVDASTIRYRATVDDPDTWARTWTIEYPFTKIDQPVLEYACHEGNYSLENALRGHRAEEKQKQ